MINKIDKSLERVIETKKSMQITNVRNKKWNVDTYHIDNKNIYKKIFRKNFYDLIDKFLEWHILSKVIQNKKLQ